MSIKLAVIMATTLAAGTDPDTNYLKAVQEYRTRLETTLKSDTGWLTVAGLHWLKPGENSFGSGPGNLFVLPAGKAPDQAGVFRFDGKKVSLKAAPGANLRVNGKPFTEGPIQNDANEATPDAITLGDLTITVIDRGGKIGLRLRDKSSKYRKAFT
ncbi:MAG: hypothetical protein ACK5ZJ_22545, partial [Acidobacteriota bacterium]